MKWTYGTFFLENFHSGLPYPQQAPTGRGLLFGAYQTSIAGQFVLLSGNWMNSHDRPQASGGSDVLMGRATEGRRMRVNGPDGFVELLATIGRSPCGGSISRRPTENKGPWEFPR